MREPEGEGLAARVPASPAASRPRPAAACPAAAAEKEEEEEDDEEEEEEKGWAGLPRAALAAVRGARAGRPRRGAARTETRGRSGAQGQRTGRRSALQSRATRPPPASLFRRRLRSARSPASDVMRRPRGCRAGGHPLPTQSLHPCGRELPRLAAVRL